MGSLETGMGSVLEGQPSTFAEEPPNIPITRCFCRPRDQCWWRFWRACCHRMPNGHSQCLDDVTWKDQCSWTWTTRKSEAWSPTTFLPWSRLPCGWRTGIPFEERGEDRAGALLCLRCCSHAQRPWGHPVVVLQESTTYHRWRCFPSRPLSHPVTRSPSVGCEIRGSVHARHLHQCSCAYNTSPPRGDLHMVEPLDQDCAAQVQTLAVLCACGCQCTSRWTRSKWGCFPRIPAHKEPMGASNLRGLPERARRDMATPTYRAMEPRGLYLHPERQHLYEMWGWSWHGDWSIPEERRSSSSQNLPWMECQQTRKRNRKGQEATSFCIRWPSSWSCRPRSKQCVAVASFHFACLYVGNGCPHAHWRTAEGYAPMD